MRGQSSPRWKASNNGSVDEASPGASRRKAQASTPSTVGAGSITPTRSRLPLTPLRSVATTTACAVVTVACVGRTFSTSTPSKSGVAVRAAIGDDHGAGVGVGGVILSELRGCVRPELAGEWRSKMDASMRWYHYVAYFFGGAFLANTLPHLGNGISGTRLSESVRVTSGEGLSSSTVNVLWGLFNLAVGYVLVCRVGSFDLRKTQHVLVLGAGILLMSVMLAHAFGRFHGGL